MSISGLHIAMLASLGFALTYWLWRCSTRLTLFLPARKAAAIVALLVALGYALLSGLAVPAQRTVYMVAVVAAALWLNRNFSLGQILSIALLGVLIPDPWAVLSPGFWLSFGAVALILYVTAYRLKPSHWLVEYGKVQWAMTIGLIPMLLALFQQVSLEQREQHGNQADGHRPLHLAVFHQPVRGFQAICRDVQDECHCAERQPEAGRQDCPWVGDQHAE